MLRSAPYQTSGGSSQPRVAKEALVTCPSLFARRLSIEEQRLQEKAREVYETRIAAGVSRERVRKDLPLSTYTEAYWKIDLHNLPHFLSLWMGLHAQQEIRAYATIIGEKIVTKWVPVVWEALLDYRRPAVNLSRIETGIIGCPCLEAPGARAKPGNILRSAQLW